MDTIYHIIKTESRFIMVIPLKIFHYQHLKNLCLLTMLKYIKITGIIWLFVCISVVHAQTLKQMGAFAKYGGERIFCEYNNELFCAGGYKFGTAGSSGYGFLWKWNGL